MKAAKNLVLLIVCMGLSSYSIFSIISCNDKADNEAVDNSSDKDDDFINNQDDDSAAGQDDDFIVVDDDYPPECEGNVSPQLLGVSLIINGEETEMPATVYTTDEMQLAIEYYDENCNLTGGDILIIPDNDDPNYSALDKIMRHHYQITTIGCSSEQEGVPYILSIDPYDYLLPEWLKRTRPLQFHLYDACYFSSNPYLTLDFTVVEE